MKFGLLHEHRFYSSSSEKKKRQDEEKSEEEGKKRPQITFALTDLKPKHCHELELTPVCKSVVS